MKSFLFCSLWVQECWCTSDSVLLPRKWAEVYWNLLEKSFNLIHLINVRREPHFLLLLCAVNRLMWESDILNCGRHLAIKRVKVNRLWVHNEITILLWDIHLQNPLEINKCIWSKSLLAEVLLLTVKKYPSWYIWAEVGMASSRPWNWLNEAA